MTEHFHDQIMEKTKNKILFIWFYIQNVDE